MIVSVLGTVPAGKTADDWSEIATLSRLEVDKSAAESDGNGSQLLPVTGAVEEEAST
jgi:hypothetical protein